MLKTNPKINPLCNNILTKVLCLLNVVNTLNMRLLYDSSLFFLGISGKTIIITKAISKFKIAAIMYTDLHPQNPAMIPLTNLENNMPAVIPDETIPTICPRSSSLLKSPARGKMICPDTVTIPMQNNDKDNYIRPKNSFLSDKNVTSYFKINNHKPLNSNKYNNNENNIKQTKNKIYMSYSIDNKKEPLNTYNNLRNKGRGFDLKYNTLITENNDFNSKLQKYQAKINTTYINNMTSINKSNIIKVPKKK